MNKTIYLAAISLSILLFTGCGVNKTFKSPQVGTEGLYRDYADSLATESDENFGFLYWEDVFTDPYLQDLIKRALKNNTDMKSAYLKVEQAEAALKSARLAFLPSFNIPIQGGVSSWDSGKAVQAYSLPIVSSWEIDLFGRVNNAKRRSEAVYQQSVEYTYAV